MEVRSCPQHENKQVNHLAQSHPCRESVAIGAEFGYVIGLR